jgi:hypothetical protein
VRLVDLGSARLSRLPCAIPFLLPRSKVAGESSEIWGEEREDDVAWRDPRVGKGNMETAGVNCVLGIKIFSLYSQQLY